MTLPTGSAVNTRHAFTPSAEIQPSLIVDCIGPCRAELALKVLASTHVLQASDDKTSKALSDLFPCRYET
jgi:hypothetical protein